MPVALVTVTVVTPLVAKPLVELSVKRSDVPLLMGVVTAWLNVSVFPEIPVTVVLAGTPAPVMVWPTAMPVVLLTTTVVVALVPESLKLSGVLPGILAAWLSVSVFPTTAVTVVPPLMPVPVMV